MKLSRIKRMYTVCGSTLVALAAVGVLTFSNQTQVHADAGQADNQVAVTSAAGQGTPANSTTASDMTNANGVAATSAVSQQAVSSSSAAPIQAQAVSQPAAAQAPIATQKWSVNNTQADAVDISWMNGGMNQGTFEQMRRQGLKHVIIQLTKVQSNGQYMHDPYAAEQVADAYHAGLGVAAYHYAGFRNRGQAINEANYFADRADQLHLSKGTLMIADVEARANMYGGVANDLRAFFDQLNRRGYWNHGVYTGLYFDSVYNISSVVGRGRTWIAKYYYDHQATPARNRQIAGMGYGAWQYTGHNGGYNVAGYDHLDGSVDLGFFESAIGHEMYEGASLDNFQYNPSTNRVNVSGWFASHDNQGRDANRYVFLLNSQGRELARQKVNAGSRPDVKQAYYYLYGAENSGFSASFDVDQYPALRDAIMNGMPIKVDFRDSADPAGNYNYNEHQFAARSLANNYGWLDSFSAADGVLHVSGWHATNMSMNRPSRWAIIYDQTTHRELGRQKVTSQVRNDVAAAHPDVYQASQSGYSTDFKLADYPAIARAIMHGDRLQVVARYSNDARGGEGSHVDYWSPVQSFGTASAAWLDQFMIQGRALHASGWYADDRSAGASHRYLILYDQTQGRELRRQEVKGLRRDDVLRAHRDIQGADLAGFSADFALDGNVAQAIQRGDNLQIIARYSDAANGEGDYSQHWFDARRFTANDGYLDSLTAGTDAVVASGWHCADQAAGRAYHLDILIDKTTGREIARVFSDTTARPDVARVYPDVYNSAQSGFTAHFAMNDAIKDALAQHHQLQIVDRYAGTADGNHDYVDYWYQPRQL